MIDKSFNFDLSGLDNLLDGLAKLGSGGVEEAVRQGLYDAALELQVDAKNNVPVAEKDGGRLRDSICITEIPDGYDVGTNVEYAIYQEFGTGQRGDPSVDHVTEKEHIKNGKGTGEFYPYMGIPPQPYIYPALEKVKKKVPDYIEERLNFAIKGAF